MEKNKKNFKHTIYTIIININSTSIVIQMEVNDNKYLFIADAEEDVESNDEIIWEDIDVLKVGHHGSNTSSTEQFINTVLPEIAIISVNEDNNSYGHPSETVIERLEDKECEVYRTYNIEFRRKGNKRELIL